MSRAWRTTPAGLAAYTEVRRAAQAAADADGFDRGIEGNDVFKTWRFWLLPQKRYRAGHELACEVVTCTAIGKIRPGHGF